VEPYFANDRPQRPTRGETQIRPEGDRQRHPLPQQEWMPVANASRSLSALAKRLLELPSHGETRSLGENQPGARSRAPGKRGRQATPSYVIIDSQSVKTNYEGEQRGFHGGKKIKGRSRQVAVDTEGNLLCAHVHAANYSDTIEGCVLMKLTLQKLPRILAVCADAGYRGSFEIFMQEEFGLPVHISEKIKDGFAVIPRRWVVERTFAWLNGQRRLSKDYEKITRVSESMIYVASIARLLRTYVN